MNIKLYKNIIDIKLTAELNIMSISKPVFRNTDEGVTRRGVLVQLNNRSLPEDVYNQLEKKTRN